MATKRKTKAQQQEELIQTLKFTPRTYTLTLSGYGGECYCGTVSREIYDFFASKKIDINQFAWEWDDEKWADVPDNMRPFDPGSPYECDNMFHASGAELSDLNYLTVTDENNDTHWESNLGFSDLTAAGVDVERYSDVDLDEVEEGTIVFWGGSGEKGCFFEGEINLTAPFDPAKLKIIYDNCDGWGIINYVEYDGEEIDGSNGYSTTGKWSDAKWVVGDGVEPYEAEERDDDWAENNNSEDEDSEDEGLSSFQTLANTLAEANWNTMDVKPTTKGTYEAKFSLGAWPVGNIRNAEWTGRSWKENGKKAPEMLGWREIEAEE